MQNYRICKKCVMDTSDPEISFDEKGICNHCKNYFNLIKEKQKNNRSSKDDELSKLIEKIKHEGRNRKYDCILGISGGIDSTFLAYQAKELGLRPLAVHLDNGWNTELSVNNIDKALNILDMDFHYKKEDWEEFRSLQLAFLKSSTPDVEIPTDHAIWAYLYQTASNYKLKYILFGVNIRTEAIMPKKWSYGHSDWKYIKKINEKYGTRTLKNFSHYSFWDVIKYKLFKRIKRIDLLDYIEYNKMEAKEILKEKIGWVDYGAKHHESIITRFVQGYILPKKFGIDKRRAHLSNLICSGQLTREEASEELKKNPYPSDTLKKNEKEYVIKKLGLSEEEFEKIMMLQKKSFWDYPSYERSLWFKVLTKIFLRSRKGFF